MSPLGRRLEWFPTLGGLPVLLGFDKPYLLLGVDGTAPVPSKPQTTQGPLQPGVTFLSNKIEGRTIEVELAVATESWEESEDAIAALTASLAVVPDGGLGLLRMLRDGFDDLDILATPTDSPREKTSAKTLECVLRIYTLEFFAPMPYWQTSAQNQVSLGASGGVEYPLEYPLEYTEVSSIQVIDYQGDVPVWPFIQVFGEGVNPIIRRTDANGNVAQLAFTKNLSLTGNDELQVVTQFGEKQITLITPDEASNAFDFLDINASRFWQLNKGVNTVEVEWEALSGGHVNITWQELKAGI